MRQLYTIMSAIILMATSCHAQRIDTSTVSNFDTERYMGRWYEIARFDHRFERGMEDALERAFAFSKAGADAIMIHSRKKSPDEIFEFVEKFCKEDAIH